MNARKRGVKAGTIPAESTSKQPKDTIPSAHDPAARIETSAVDTREKPVPVIPMGGMPGSHMRVRH